MAVLPQRRQLNLTLDLPNFLLPPLPPSSLPATSSSSSEFRLSDLEKLQVLGHGNGGTVYKVRHRPTNSTYALKLIHTDPSNRHSVTREIDILRRSADTPHVVCCHAVLHTPSLDVALLLEHAEGGSLDSLLRRRARRPFPELALAAVARQALLGLAGLHARQIVHRDIKPANLLINRKGEIIIADFGVGKVLRRSLDPCCSYVGTCAYMSPERFDPEAYGGDYDPYAADVWSLGLAILELHRGHFPLLPEGARPDWAALMCAICFGDVSAATAVGEAAGASAEFRGFIECCLQKESGKRWSVSQLLGHPFVSGVDREQSERALRALLVESSEEELL